MCGIMGFIGRTRNQKEAKLSYQLASKLLAETVSRGSHATGTYAILPPKEGASRNRCFVYKLDAPSTQFVKTKSWRSIMDQDPFLLLGHCRWYTHGSPQDHINNHPHVSDDNSLAIIHNGVISGYTQLKTKYPCKGECDSEVLLRIIESEPTILKGIQKIFDVVSGSMACMVCKYDKDGQVAEFYAFRNSGNPLHWVDLREELGQVFLSSTEDLATSAMKNSGMPKEIRDCTIESIPVSEIWHCTAEDIAATIGQDGKVLFGADGVALSPWKVTPVVIQEKPTTTYSAAASGNCSWPSSYSGAASSGTDTNATHKKLKALVDVIMENLTEIDEEITSGALFGFKAETLQKSLEGIAWETEQIVNPALSGTNVDDLID